MPRTIHVYCDESCHLENDRQRAMVLGALWCPANRRKFLARRVKALRHAHGVGVNFEIKWVKVSSGKLGFYRDLIDLFFDEPLLGFRGLVVPNKARLRHEEFSQSHDEFYYKMWYFLLKVFLDQKDTRGGERLRKLHDVLCSKNDDFDKSIINSVELIQSSDLVLLQLADLLIGALSYLHRRLSLSPAEKIIISPAKKELVDHLRKRSGLSLQKSTLLKEGKFNLFIWRPQE